MVGSAGLVLDPAAHTTLAFVQNAPDGDREFSFYRDPGADELLTAGELPEELGRAGIFHFGSLSGFPCPLGALAVKSMSSSPNAITSYIKIPLFRLDFTENCIIIRL